jgi:hypothetical protein
MAPRPSPPPTPPPPTQPPATPPISLPCRHNTQPCTTADIVTSLKDYRVATDTPFKDALRDFSSRIAAARATYTTADVTEFAIHDASIKHALQRFASRQYPTLLGDTVTDAALRSHSLDAILHQWEAKKYLNGVASAAETNANIAFPNSEVYSIQDVNAVTSSSGATSTFNRRDSGSGSNGSGRRERERDPRGYAKGVWRKVHYACNFSPNNCFNCLGGHPYPACTATFAGEATFTTNARAAITNGTFPGKIDALPRTNSYFTDCCTAYDLCFKRKDIASATDRHDPPDAAISALHTRLRADFEARK